MKETYSPSV